MLFALLAAAGCAADPPAAPELTGVTGWVNADKPLTLADQKGKVVVVHFMTHTCINCVHNYPHYRKWVEDYKGKDVLLLGVHTPEFESDKNLDGIKAAAKKAKLSFPIAVDNDAANWKAWGNRYWPCVYLVDKAGKVRDKWEGELGEAGEKKVRANIDALLAEK